VGEISDVIMGQTGNVDVVLVDVGGFLGIGEKSVAVNLADIQTVPDGDSADDYFLVFKGSQAELEGAPAFSDAAAMPAAAEGDAMTDAPAEDTAAATDPAVTADPAATDDTAAASDTAAVADPAGGMMPADMATLTSEKLTGASVRGRADENIGEVSDVVIEGDQVTGIVVDVGGFLGVGEKPVVLAPDMIEVWQDPDGSIYEVKVKATKEQLEALPAHNAG
jgi:PRC-barrel domain